MDINELIKYINQNKPVLTVFILILWWFERNGRMSSEKRERGLLRELAECPPEPEQESVAEKIGVVSTTIALVAASAIFLVGCNMTYTTTKTPPAPSWIATEASKDLTAIATPSIIEVTAAPEWQWDVIGTYTPTVMDMNIRSCSHAIDTLCPVVGELPVGDGAQFFAIVRLSASGDVWLCLDGHPVDGGIYSDCGRMVAWVLDGVEYGRVTIHTPDG